jgi:hypothetical protein
MNVVASWTGGRADTLRQALRMTNEAFAEHLGVAVRTVAYWRALPDVIPRPVMQEMLDVALARAPEQVRAQFGLLLAEREQGQAPSLASSRLSVPDDVASLTAWITSSNTSDQAIEHIEQATVVLADLHTQLTAHSSQRPGRRAPAPPQDARTPAQRQAAAPADPRASPDRQRPARPRQRPARRPRPGPGRPQLRQRRLDRHARSRDQPGKSVLRTSQDRPMADTTMPKPRTSPNAASTTARSPR